MKLKALISFGVVAVMATAVVAKSGVAVRESVSIDATTRAVEAFAKENKMTAEQAAKFKAEVEQVSGMSRELGNVTGEMLKGFMSEAYAKVVGKKAADVEASAAKAIDTALVRSDANSLLGNVRASQTCDLLKAVKSSEPSSVGMEKVTGTVAKSIEADILALGGRVDNTRAFLSSTGFDADVVRGTRLFVDALKSATGTLDQRRASVEGPWLIERLGLEGAEQFKKAQCACAIGACGVGAN